MSREAHERRRPEYPLRCVQTAFVQGRFQVTMRVVNHLERRGWTRRTIGECVASLVPEDFHKSQQHRTRPEAWLDIYKPVFCGERLYVKFTLQEDGKRYRVLSFCGDGEDH